MTNTRAAIETVLPIVRACLDDTSDATGADILNRLLLISDLELRAESEEIFGF